MLRAVYSIAMTIALTIAVSSCGSSSSTPPAIDPLQIEVVGLSNRGGFGTSSYALLVTNRGCAYFYGGNQPPESHYAGSLRGAYVGMGNGLSDLKFLLSKNNLLATPPSTRGRYWPNDATFDILTVLYKGDVKPRVMYSSPDDPTDARMVALMVEGIAFRTHWVPYARPGTREPRSPASDQTLKSCPWPSNMMNAVALPKPTPTVQPGYRGRGGRP